MSTIEKSKPDTSSSSSSSSKSLSTTSSVSTLTQQIPLVIIMAMIGWLAYDGKLKAEKCYEKSKSEDLLTPMMVNDVSFGVAIGVGIAALVPSVFMGPMTRYAIAIIMGGMAITTIVSFNKLADKGCDQTNIVKEKNFMYMAMGIAAGVFANSIIILGTKSLPITWQIRVMLILGCVGVITLSAFNIFNTLKNCADEDNEDLKKFKTNNIIFISVASVMLVMIGVSAVYLP